MMMDGGDLNGDDWIMMVKMIMVVIVVMMIYW